MNGPLFVAWLLKQTFVATLLQAHLIALAFAKEGLLVVVVEEEGPVEKIDGLALARGSSTHIHIKKNNTVWSWTKYRNNFYKLLIFFQLELVLNTFFAHIIEIYKIAMNMEDTVI